MGLCVYVQCCYQLRHHRGRQDVEGDRAVLQHRDQRDGEFRLLFNMARVMPGTDLLCTLPYSAPQRRRPHLSRSTSSPQKILISAFPFHNLSSFHLTHLVL
jgi:hypothetical protein